MVSVDKHIDGAVKVMYDNLKQQNAVHELHLCLENIFSDQSARAVVSVYVDEHPAHIVLKDLLKWAEAVGNREVIQKITELKGI